MTTMLHRASDAALINGPERAGSPGSEQQSRSGFAPPISTQETCPTAPPVLIGPGDDTGKLRVPNPITFRWNAAPGASRYRVTYSLGGHGNGKDQELGVTTGTSYTATMPEGREVKWKVFSLGPEGSKCGEMNSKNLKFIPGGACNLPTIAVTPASARISAGDRATFTASTTNSPDSISWYQGPSGDRSRRVGSGSTFTTPALTQPTSYWAEAANACGSDASATITVGICATPSIATQPADIEITEGSSATLRVIASGDAPLRYQWFRGTTQVGTNSNTLDTGALSGTAAFHVVITNDCGTVTSRTATVTVRAGCTAPVITSHPSSSEIAEGSAVTLRVTATGTAPLRYQWYRGTTAVGTNSNALDTGALTGTAAFRVVVTNACGEAASSTATITVRTACDLPSIVRQPAGSTILEGATATLTVAAAGSGPLTYQWYEGPRLNRAKPVGANENRFTTAALAQTTQYWVDITNACGAAVSQAATVEVTPRPNACRTPSAPQVMAVATVTSGELYTVTWTPVDGVARYVLDEADDASFERPESRNVTATSFTFSHDVKSPRSFFYRVRAVAACDGSQGAASAAIRVAVVPPVTVTTTNTDLVVPYHERKRHVTNVTLRVDPSAAGFTAEGSEAWMSVSPSSGGVPPTGELVFRITIDANELPHGTSTASLRVTTIAGSDSRIGMHGGTTTAVPISISLVTPVTPGAGSDDGETLIIPAVAHADGSNARWQSDVRIAHTYDKTIKYRLTFTAAGADLDSALATEVAVKAGETIALDDVLGRWFGSGMAAAGQTGTLEIRALNALQGSLGKTLATSRLFNAAGNGSFGQFIAAVPLAKFLARSSSGHQTLVALAQSTAFRSNLGVVEGSGRPANVRLDVFTGSGEKVFETVLALAAGEHRQIGPLLAAQGIDTTNARVDVTHVAGAGSVFGYASVIDNATGDPSFVPPVEVAGPRAREYTIAGVANLTTADGKWQTDVRLFNGGNASALATLALYRDGESAPAATREVTVEAGQVLALDDVPQSFFGITGAGGALRISTAIDSALVPAARTYHARADGTFGQFVPAATGENAAAAGTDALRILQVEESSRFRSNVGLTEVSGQPVTVEISAFTPGRKSASVTRLDLQPNEFRQLNSLLRAMGFTDAYNASVSVRVVGGTGRVIAYASVVDNATQDPTYVMAQ